MQYAITTDAGSAEFEVPSAHEKFFNALKMGYMFGDEGGQVVGTLLSTEGKVLRVISNGLPDSLPTPTQDTEIQFQAGHDVIPVAPGEVDAILACSYGQTITVGGENYKFLQAMYQYGSGPLWIVTATRA